MPSPKSVSDIKSALLHPATTSHFEMQISLPKKLNSKYFSDNGINISNVNLSKLNLLCSEASLPGSNLATLDLNNDYTGVTERYAYRRVYDDRIDLTFYVDAENYLPIRVFEIWMKYIAQESITAPEDQNRNKLKPSSKDKTYYYGFAYPDDYIAEGLKVTKFEKSTYGNIKGKKASSLTYEFIRSFPISVSSMPVSYDSSSLLKCTVSMSYIRYVVNVGDPGLEENPTSPNTTTTTPSIEEQALINSAGPGFTDAELDRRARSALGIGEYSPNLQRNINGQALPPENAQYNINGDIIDTGDRLITVNDFK